MSEEKILPNKETLQHYIAQLAEDAPAWQKARLDVLSHIVGSMFNNRELKQQANDCQEFLDNLANFVCSTRLTKIQFALLALIITAVLAILIITIVLAAQHTPHLGQHIFAICFTMGKKALADKFPTEVARLMLIQTPTIAVTIGTGAVVAATLLLGQNRYGFSFGKDGKALDKEVNKLKEYAKQRIRAR